MGEGAFDGCGFRARIEARRIAIKTNSSTPAFSLAEKLLIASGMKS
jgi:hypothetical protein